MSKLPKIKVCGITSLVDAQFAMDCGADAIGFIAESKSARYIEAQQVLDICKSLQGSVRKVAVFVNSNPQEVATYAHISGCNTVQLCGEENIEDFVDFPFQILRRVPASADGFSEMDKWREVALGFVIDHPSSPGGSGKQVDFEIAKQLAAKGDCLLAGGLSDKSVVKAINSVNPAGVDASSGLEMKPREKNHQVVKAFVELALREIK